MANTIGRSRTNYFRVKDLAAFKADLDKYGVSYGSWDDNYPNLVLDEGSNNQPAGAIALFTFDFWPMFDEDSVATRLDLGDDAPVPQDYEAIEDLVAAHLVDTDVAVFMGIAYEKMRFVDGYAVAVNAHGERNELSLQDIYENAAHLATDGTPITPAVY